MLPCLLLVAGCLCLWLCSSQPAGKRPGPHGRGPTNGRQQRVVEAFLHGWRAYRASCWGKDEVRPVSRNCTEEFGGMGVQIVDALDSLLMMGLEAEYAEARRWVIQNFTADLDAKVSVFEVAIRVLGGLLSAHFLAGEDEELLQRASDLGRRLLPAWREGPLPHELVNLATGEVGSQEPQFGSSLAEVGTLQLEFKSLSAATGDPRFHWRAEHVMDLLGPLLREAGGLLPIMLAPSPPLRWTNSRVTLGGRGDSFYEYLLKQWLLGNRTEDRYLSAYRSFTRAVHRALVGRSRPSNLTFVREVSSSAALKAYIRPGSNFTWSATRDPFAETLGQTVFVLQVPADPEPTAGPRPGLPSGGAPGQPGQAEEAARCEEVAQAAGAAGEGAASDPAAAVQEGGVAEASGEEEGGGEPAWRGRPEAETCDASGAGEEPLEPQAETCDASGAGEEPLEPQASDPAEAARRAFEAMFGQGGKMRLVYVVIPSMSAEDACTTAELLLARRWDVLPSRIGIGVPQGGELPRGPHVHEAISQIAGKQLAGQCERWGYFKMDHLACFLPGLLALGVLTGAAQDPDADLRLAADLAEACARMWLDSPMGLAPESVAWNVFPGRPDMQVLGEASHSSLRPETVESLWYLHLATGDSKYQEWGWRIFEAIQDHARVPHGGYSGIEDVREVDAPRRRDRMETFVLSETFKYLFLLFADEQPFDLSQVVFNTEGHPLPVLDPAWARHQPRRRRRRRE